MSAITYNHHDIQNTKTQVSTKNTSNKQISHCLSSPVDDPLSTDAYPSGKVTSMLVSEDPKIVKDSDTCSASDD